MGHKISRKLDNFQFKYPIKKVTFTYLYFSPLNLIYFSKQNCKCRNLKKKNCMRSNSLDTDF